MNPIDQLREEHEAGREILTSIQEAAADLPVTASAVADLLTLLAGHLEAHIRKENQVLFPMAARLGEDDPALREAFERARPDPTGTGLHDRELVTKLEASYDLAG